MSKPLAFILVLVTVGAGFLIWFLDANGTTRTSAAAPEENTPLEPGLATRAGSDQRDTVAPHVHDSEEERTEKHTKRELLQEYWGDRWPTVQQEILSKGGDLDSVIDSSAITPWEDVEEDLRALVQSDSASILRHSVEALQAEPKDDQYNQILQNNGLLPSEENRAALHAVTENYANDMARVMEELVLAEGRYRQRVWEEGLYAVGPFFEVGGPDSLQQPGGGWSISSNVQEWSIYFRLDPAEDPVYANALADVQRVRSERQEGWNDVLEALR